MFVGGGGNLSQVKLGFCSGWWVLDVLYGTVDPSCRLLGGGGKSRCLVLVYTAGLS